MGKAVLAGWAARAAVHVVYGFLNRRKTIKNGDGKSGIWMGEKLAAFRE
jgi:hypothetical protein